MNAAEIGRELNRGPSGERLAQLAQAPEKRRREIDARIAQIAQPASRHYPVPEERRRAVEQGVDALRKLDDEEKDLRIERGLLDHLESLIYQRTEQLETERLRREIPAARRDLAKRIKAVRDAAAALDGASAQLRAAVEVLASYERTGDPFPLDDAACAELLELREAQWAPRTVAVLQPPNDRAFPRAWSLFWTAIDGGGRYTRRTKPTDTRGDVRAVVDDPNERVPARERRNVVLLDRHG